MRCLPATLASRAALRRRQLCGCLVTRRWRPNSDRGRRWWPRRRRIVDYCNDDSRFGIDDRLVLRWFDCSRFNVGIVEANHDLQTTFVLDDDLLNWLHCIEQDVWKCILQGLVATRLTATADTSDWSGG